MSEFKMRNSVFGLAVLSLIGVGIFNPIQATTNFQDVPSTHIYSEQIRYMKEKGISYGFNNGTEYRPESNITRKEIITLLVKAKYTMDEIMNCIPSNGYTGKNIFNDVPSTHHFAPAICMAKVKTIAVGYSNGNFGPDDATTAHAGIKVIMRTLANDLPIDMNAPLEEYTQYFWDKGFYPPTINRANESNVHMNRGEVAYLTHLILNNYKKLCLQEGQSATYSQGLSCCEGLEPIGALFFDPTQNKCVILPTGGFTCVDLSKCGDGICDKSENLCNCPQDCD